jgi:cytochrome oxidase assembly protein ShyY1
VASDPAEAAAAPGTPQLVPLGVPEPSEGPHLSYAVQWFTFTVIAAGGYLVLLRHVARDRGRWATAPSESLVGGDEGRW